MTPGEIRELTLDDVNRIFRHWQRFPPVRLLVALAIDFKFPPPEDGEDAGNKYMTADDLKRLMAMTGGKIPGVS